MHLGAAKRFVVLVTYERRVTETARDRTNAREGLATSLAEWNARS